MKTKKKPKKGRTRGTAGDIQVGRFYTLEAWRALPALERVKRWMKYRLLAQPGSELEEFGELPLQEKVQILRGDIPDQF